MFKLIKTNVYLIDINTPYNLRASRNILLMQATDDIQYNIENAINKDNSNTINNILVFIQADIMRKYNKNV